MPFQLAAMEGTIFCDPVVCALDASRAKAFLKLSTFASQRTQVAETNAAGLCANGMRDSTEEESGTGRDRMTCPTARRPSGKPAR
jgi:hypothetical protein